MSCVIFPVVLTVSGGFNSGATCIVGFAWAAGFISTLQHELAWKPKWKQAHPLRPVEASWAKGGTVQKQYTVAPMRARYCSVNCWNFDDLTKAHHSFKDFVNKLEFRRSTVVFFFL